MKEVFEKIKEELEERAAQAQKDIGRSNTYEDAAYADGKWEAYEDAIEIVNQIAEEYVPDANIGKMNGWISVEECLPDNSEYILLSFANFSIPLIGRYEEDSNGGAFYVGDEEDSCVSQDMFVDAWQPLPEQYRKGE